MMSTFAVTNEERSVLVVWLQKFFLGFDSLYFAKVPPQHAQNHMQLQ